MSRGYLFSVGWQLVSGSPAYDKSVFKKSCQHFHRISFWLLSAPKLGGLDENWEGLRTPGPSLEPPLLLPILDLQSYRLIVDAANILVSSVSLVDVWRHSVVLSPPVADCRPELARWDSVERLPSADDSDGGRDETTGVAVDSCGQRVESVCWASVESTAVVTANCGDVCWLTAATSNQIQRPDDTWIVTYC